MEPQIFRNDSGQSFWNHHQDVLALEAVRVFLPDVFVQLPRLRSALTGRGAWGGRRDDQDGALIKKTIEESADQGDVVTALIRELFPHGARHLGGPSYSEGFHASWQRQRRVAVASVLDFYLHRRLPNDVVRAAKVFEVVKLLGDRKGLAMLLGELSGAEFENLLGQLEAHEEEFPASDIVSAVGALMDESHRLREDKQHFFDLGADMALSRVVYRLLRRLPAGPARDAAIDELIPTLTWLSAQRVLVRIAEGHELADALHVEAWKEEILDRFIEAPREQLLQERLLAVLLDEGVSGGGDRGAKALARLDDDLLFARFLSSAMTEESSMAMGSLVSRVEQRFPWTRMENRFGAEWLKRRTLKASEELDATTLDPRQALAVNLARRYAEGWRPKERFGADDDGAPVPSTPSSGDVVQITPDEDGGDAETDAADS